MGYTPDGNQTEQNYFYQALKKHVVKRGFLNRDESYFKDVYTAHVSPLGCVHDRACELY